MKAKSILISAILLLLAAGYIYFFELPAAERNEKAKKPFAGVNAASLQAIEIKNSKNEFKPVKFTNSKSDDPKSVFDAKSWKLENAEYAELEAATLSTLVNQIIATDLGVALPKQDLDTDMSVYGLKNPELELSITLNPAGLNPSNNKAQKQQESLKFSFGKRSEFIGKRYVALNRDDAEANQQELYMLDDLLYFAANKTLLDFRKQNPLQIEDSKQKRISINSESFPVALSLEKVAGKIPLEQQEVWQISAPRRATADEQVITDMLRAVKNLKLKKVIEGSELEAYRQVVNKALVEINLSEDPAVQSQQTIRTAKQSAESTELVVSWSKYPNTLFVFEDEKLFSHFEDPEHYKKLTFFKIDTQPVKAIEVYQNGTQIVKASKDKDQWSFSENSQTDFKPADAVFVEEYLQDLTKISAIDFPAQDEGPEQFGFQNPVMKIVLTLQSMQEGKDYQRVFIVGQKFDFDQEGKAYFASVDDMSEPFIIDEKDIDKLRPKVSGWAIVPTPAPTGDTK